MTKRLVTLLCILMSFTFTSFAQEGKGQAELETASKMYEGEKYAQALLWYKKSATKGNTEAMEMLIEMYIEGLGGPVDLKAAKLWQTKLDKANAKGDKPDKVEKEDKDDTDDAKEPKRKNRSSKDDEEEDKLPYNRNDSYEPD